MEILSKTEKKALVIRLYKEGKKIQRNRLGLSPFFKSESPL